MKEKLKNNKGITLIALVITIIVLLILAMVTINIATSNGIIKKSKDATDTYNKAYQNDINEINNGIAQIDAFMPKWYTVSADEKKQCKVIEEERLYFVASHNVEDGSTYDKETGIAIFLLGDLSGKDILIEVLDARNNQMLVFASSDNAIKEYLGVNDGQLKPEKWYAVHNMGDGELEEYNGASPMQISDFTSDEIFCESYLQRVINSFNK